MPHSSQWLQYLKDEHSRIAYQQAAVEAASHFAGKERKRASEQLSAKRKQLEQLERKCNLLGEVEEDASMRELGFHGERSWLARRAVELEHGRLPIQDFPVDILRIIFGYLVEDDVETRWVLSRVCRSWQDVTISTATLWSHLEIDFVQQTTISLLRIQAVLLNGALSPLFLHLIFHRPRPPSQPDWSAWGGPPSPPDVPPQPDLAFDYVELALAHSDRWRGLTWTMHGKEGVNGREAGWIARRVERATLGNLQDLKILVQRREGAPISECAAKIVQQLCAAAIALTTLSLRNGLLYPIASRALLEITLDRCILSIDCLLSVLGGQSSLRSLRLRDIDFRTEVERGSSSPMLGDLASNVEMPSLTRILLSSGLDQHQYFRFLLRHLSCPHLRRAVIRTDGMSELVPDMTTFFGQVSCLTHLGISIPSANSLARLLEKMPFVEEFTGLYGPELDVGDDEEETEASDTAALSIIGTILPSLKHLSLSFSTSVEAVLAWLQASARTPTLETFFCPDMEEWSEEDRMRLGSILRIEKRFWLESEFDAATLG